MSLSNHKSQLISSNIVNFLTSILIGVIYFGFLPPSALASTDPQTATTSATATVPSAQTTATTSDTTAPYPVILISPVDGANTNQSRPEFVFYQTSDPNSNTVYYTLKLNGVATFLGISNTGNTQKNNFVSHIGDNRIYLNPTFDFPEGEYDWSVDAYDASNNTSYSATWHFTIDQTAPTLSILSIDQLYPYPSIIEGSIFDLTNPGEHTLTILTEPWATITINLLDPNGNHPNSSYPTDQSGLLTITLTLLTGQTQLDITSFDHAGLTTTLPRFYLSVTPHLFAGILDLSRLTPPFASPQTITSITVYPATISQIKSLGGLTVTILLMLAITILILLIIIWKYRYNILIIDKQTNKPYRSLIVYHSRPTHSAKFKNSIGRVFVTNHDPILYELGGSGKAYIKNLGRYSSLTIRTSDGNTLILSLSASLNRYLIIL